MALPEEYSDFRLLTSCPSGSKKNSTTYETTSGIMRYRFTLGEVLSWNLDLEVVVGNGWTRITLKEVPRFVVDAFDIIMMKGLQFEGLFRKEGNSTRLNQPEVHEVYRGVRPIPNNFTVFDVCTMIKRFLKDLKPTLINSAEVRARLLEKAKRARISKDYRLSHPEMVRLFENVSDPLPPSHMGTLGYVMRYLARIAKHEDSHKMTVDSLAVVLVGSVFGEFMGGGTEPRKKGLHNRKCSPSILLETKDGMEIQVAAVKLLIVNSDLIALPYGHYVSSNKTTPSHSYLRSTSAMPDIRCPSISDSEQGVDVQQSSLAGMNVFNMAKASLSQRTLTRRDSDLTHVKSSKPRDTSKVQKRSSSFLPIPALRGLRDRIGIPFSKRNKSPSPDRPKKAMIKSTASFVGTTNMYTSAASPMSLRGPASAYVRHTPTPTELNFHIDDDDKTPKSSTVRPLEKIRSRNAPSVSDSHRESIESTSSIGRQSRAHGRRGNTNSVSTRGRGTPNDSQTSFQFSPEGEKKSFNGTASATSTITSRSFRRVSQSEQNSFERRKGKRRESDERSVDGDGSSSTRTMVGSGSSPSVKKKKCASNGSQKTRALSRRNTVEGLVKSNGHRSNNLEIERQRRATHWGVGTIIEEKENARNSKILEIDDISQDENTFDDSKLDSFDVSKSILERMDYQARLRRIPIADRRRRNGIRNGDLIPSESLIALDRSDSDIPLHIKPIRTGNKPEELIINNEDVVKWREKSVDKVLNRRLEFIEEKDVMKNVIDMWKYNPTPRKSETRSRETSPILSPKHLAKPSMQQYLLAATSLGDHQSPTGIRISRECRATEREKRLDTVATPNMRRKSRVVEIGISPRTPQSTSSVRPVSAIPLRKLDSIGLQQNGHAWVGKSQTVVSSPQPPRRSPVGSERALSAVPTMTNYRSPSPLSLQSTQSDRPHYRSSMRDGTSSPRLSQSPLMRKAVDAAKYSISKTLSPLVTRSKSHLTEEKVSNKEYAFATPPRTRRVYSPLRSSALIYSSPSANNDRIGELSPSYIPIRKSTTSLATSKSHTTTSQFSLNESRPMSPLVSKKTSPSPDMEAEKEKSFKCPILPPMKSHEPSSKNTRKKKSNSESRRRDDSKCSAGEEVTLVDKKSRTSSRASVHNVDASDSELGFGDYNDVLKNANDEMSLPCHAPVEARPSVTLLRSSNCGLVQSRINHFQGIEQKSRVSMDTSSGRTSAISLSSVRSTETIASVDKN